MILNPTPLPLIFPCKSLRDRAKGRKIFSMSSGEMPIPVSFISIKMLLDSAVSSVVTDRCTSPPSGVNLKALESKLKNTFSMASLSKVAMMGVFGKFNRNFR